MLAPYVESGVLTQDEVDEAMSVTAESSRLMLAIAKKINDAPLG